MADYGFLARNDQDVILISDLFRNYSYENHGNISCTKSIDSGETILTVPATSGGIVAGFRPTSDYSRLVGFRKTGDDYDGIRAISNSIQSVPYIYFTEELKNPIPDWGFTVYASGGKAIFSSGEDLYFNILGVYDWSDIDPGSPTSSPCNVNSVPPGYKDISVQNADSNYFILIGYAYGIVKCWETDIGWRSTAGLKKINTNTIRVGFFNYDTTTTTVPDYTFQFHWAKYEPNWIIEVRPVPI